MDRLERIGSHIVRRALYDPAGGRQIELRASRDLAAFTLMARAGQAVARLALAIAPHANVVEILAGPGNNGGDGLEAARCLHAWGRRVRVQLIGDPARLPDDAARALARARQAGVPVDIGLAADGASKRTRPGLVIDALLGIGASRAPEGAVAEAVARIAAWRTGGVPVLAVDVPTGLDPATGRAFGDRVVTASHTLALLCLQAGLFTASGRDLAGDVWLAPLQRDIESASPTDADADAITDDDTDAAADRVGAIGWLVGAGRLSDASSPRRHAQHKGSFGDVGIVGGAAGMTGAALLAARAAHGAGAGRVFVDLLRGADAGRHFGVDPLHPELMIRDDWWQGPVDALARATVVCGCGGGDAVRAALPRLLAVASRLLLDADALNAIAHDAGLQAQLAGRAAHGRVTVLTPHPLEAARLLACDVAEVQADRLGSAVRLAERCRCIAVLKGSGTVIAAPGAIPTVNATGNASLATAGTGDVLAGWIGGRWAASAPGDDADPFRSARRVVVSAVVEHGLAAEPARPGSLRASDLVEALHRLARGRR